MERLWATWRNEYVTTAHEDDGCVFCRLLELGSDEEAGIVHRGERAFVVMNAYPYNSGHVMVAPFRHVGEPTALEPDEAHELFDLAIRATAVLDSALSPQGFNVGMNLGSVAGAGVPGHLHAHVVPRWGGDTNFMPVVGETKVLPESLAATAEKLRDHFTR